jgi:hypothetical protein
MEGTMTSRTLVLGDWHPWLRDPIDLLRALLVAGAAGFALAGDSRGALLLGGAGAVARAVRPLLLPRVYDLALVLALTLTLTPQAWGEALGLYDSIAWFDNVVHFTLPFFAAPTLYIVLARIDLVPDPKDETDSLGALTGAALLVCWARWGWGSVRRIPGENRYEGTEVSAD